MLFGKGILNPWQPRANALIGTGVVGGLHPGRIPGLYTTAAPAAPEAAYVAALIAAGATVTAPQQAAISTFMSGEIAAGRYDSIKRLYLPVWQLAAANAICMKSLTSGTFNGSILHEAKGVRASSTFGNMNTNTNLGSLGITKDSYHFALLLPEGAEEGFSLPFSVNDLDVNGISIFWNDGFSFLRITNRVFSGSFLTNLPSIITTGNDSVAGNLYFKERLSNGFEGVETLDGIVGTAFPSNNLFILGDSGQQASMGAPIGAFSVSTEFSSAQDTAYTAALKTLWETTTGLTLP